MKREHFRGVIWERTHHGKYCYTVVGVLISDQPIPELSGNETTLDGRAWGLSDVMASIPKIDLGNHKLGDASDVICSLGEWDDIRDYFQENPE